MLFTCSLHWARSTAWAAARFSFWNNLIFFLYITFRERYLVHQLSGHFLEHCIASQLQSLDLFSQCLNVSASLVLKWRFRHHFYSLWWASVISRDWLWFECRFEIFTTPHFTMLSRWWEDRESIAKMRDREETPQSSFDRQKLFIVMLAGRDLNI